jgi:hypothetical protein
VAEVADPDRHARWRGCRSSGLPCDTNLMRRGHSKGSCHQASSSRFQPSNTYYLGHQSACERVQVSAACVDEHRFRAVRWLLYPDMHVVTWSSRGRSCSATWSSVRSRTLSATASTAASPRGSRPVCGVAGPTGRDQRSCEFRAMLCVGLSPSISGEHCDIRPAKRVVAPVATGLLSSPPAPERSTPKTSGISSKWTRPRSSRARYAGSHDPEPHTPTPAIK